MNVECELLERLLQSEQHPTGQLQRHRQREPIRRRRRHAESDALIGGIRDRV
jgi:hypothetical protein